LLNFKGRNAPGPGSYETDVIKLKQSRGSVAFAKAHRDLHFGKYNSIHAALVERGIY